MNLSMRFNFCLLLSLVLIVSCGTTSRMVHEGKGLVKGEPGMNRYTENQPGETTPLNMAYDIAPPLIPHSIDGLSINRDGNDCLGCHLEGEELDEGHIATKVPASHYVNEYSKKQEADHPTGIRNNCLQCHVPQAEVDVHSRTKESN